ncbi:transglutaminase domain-containing protein [Geoglobus acetivorans]|uniref:Transglutaminase-like domain-containing protein n=1 Tax=Geoglobus acetivorans TaxID=565033 RepID=A0ABZ3H3G7_GEOAI|nr:transglutaminase domain-containing protein [Geoglobus acetivorans]
MMSEKMVLVCLVLVIPSVLSPGCASSDLHSSVGGGEALIPMPPEVKERYEFPTEVSEIESLTADLNAGVSSHDPVVMSLARRIVQDAGEGGQDMMAVQAIYSYVASNWTYVEESENFGRVSSAPEIIERGLRGGSLDYSVVMASLLEAAGFRTRIVFGCDVNDGICRACPEVFVGTEEEAKQILAGLSETFQDRIYYTHDSKGGYWLSLDLGCEHIGGKPSFERVYLIIYPAEKRWEIVTG